MALVPCQECTREISDAAPNCPHCGHPNPPKADLPTATPSLATPPMPDGPSMTQHRYTQARAAGWVMAIVGVLIVIGGIGYVQEANNEIDRYFGIEKSPAPGVIAIIGGGALILGAFSKFSSATRIAAESGSVPTQSTPSLRTMGDASAGADPDGTAGAPSAGVAPVTRSPLDDRLAELVAFWGKDGYLTEIQRISDREAVITAKSESGASRTCRVTVDEQGRVDTSEV